MNLSEAATIDPDEFMNEEVGHPDSFPPEMIKKNGYTQKYDIWACGVILYKMLYGHHPFKK